jgi:hypothetical protein
MGALTNVAKQRPSLFMSKVIIALEMLHANLPPTLSRFLFYQLKKFDKLKYYYELIFSLLNF